VPTWKRQALGHLQLVEQSNGYEAWRSMKRRMEAQAPGRHLAMLQELMSFNMKGDTVDRIQAFEIAVERYEAQSRAQVDPGLRAAKLMEAATDDLKAHVYMSVRDQRDYGAIRETLMMLALGKKTWSKSSGSRGPVPMEVDALGAGHAQGSKAQECWTCGKTGHLAKDCRQNKGPGKGKAKGGPKGKGQSKTVECWNCGKAGHLAKRLSVRRRQGCQQGKGQTEEVCPGSGR